MISRKRIPEAAVIFLLLLLFGCYCFTAFKKLLSGQKVLIRSHKDEKTFQFPTIILCPAQPVHKKLHGDFKSNMENRFFNLTLAVQNSRNLLELEMYNNSYFTSFLMQDSAENDLIVRCEMVKVPDKGKVGLNNKVQLGFNLIQPFSLFIILVCPDDNFFPSFNALFGCYYGVYENSDTKSNYTKNVGIEISRSVHHFINSEDESCLMADDAVGIFPCYLKYVESKLGCKLPWSQVSEQTEACKTANQLKEYLRILGQYMEASEVDVKTEIGCIKKCKDSSVKIVERWDSTDSEFSYMQETTVTVEEEVWLYGNSDFIADVGGYLGLLLGASCFTIFQTIQSFTLHIIDKYTV